MNYIINNSIFPLHRWQVSSLHVQSQVHRNLSRHQPQRQRASRWDSQTDPAKETTVLRRRGKGVITSPLVQVSWCSAS